MQRRYWFTLLPALEEMSTDQLQAHAFVLPQLQMSDSMDNLEELLRISGGEGQIFTVDGSLCMKSVQAMFGYDATQPMIFLVCFVRNSWSPRAFLFLQEAD